MKKNHKEENLKYLKTNENMTYQIYGDAAKAILRGKVIVIQAYPEKHEKSQINLTLDVRNYYKKKNE